MTTESDIRALEHVAKIMVDQVRVYRRAAEIETDRNAASAIKRAAGEREDLLDGLQEHIRALGANPVKHGMGLSGSHAVLVDARAALDADGCCAIAEVERGEDYLRDEVEKLVARDDVSAKTSCVLSSIARRISTTHDEISALKHYSVAISGAAVVTHASP